MATRSISVVDRGALKCDLNYLVDGNTLGTYDEPNPDTDYIEIPVYNLVIDHPDGTILWDTGVHPRANDGYWAEPMFQAFAAVDADEHHLQDDLDRAGYDLADIDYVFQSHLHSDHTGGLHNFVGTETPVFVHEEELKYAYFSEKTRHGSHGYHLPDFDRDLRWRVIRRDREQHFSGIEFLRLPGHTPGLMGTIVELKDGHTVVFTNDVVYVEANYRYEVPLGAGMMWNEQAWLDSIAQIKEIARRRDAEVVFGHDPDQYEEIQDGWP